GAGTGGGARRALRGPRRFPPRRPATTASYRVQDLLVHHSGISRAGDRPSDDEMRRTEPHRLLGRDGPGLIVPGISGEAHTGDHDPRPLPERPSHDPDLAAAGDDSMQPGLPRDPRQPLPPGASPSRPIPGPPRPTICSKSVDECEVSPVPPTRGRSPAARTAAPSMSCPPRQCTVAIPTPSSRAAPTARSTVLGMSCHL